MKRMQHPLRVYIVLVIGVLASSSAAIFVRLAQGEDVPSLVVAWGRVTLATTLLLPAVLLNRSHTSQIRQLKRRDLLLVLVSGFFLAIHFAMWITSLEYTTVLISTVLVATTPIWVALLEILWLKARLSQMVIAGLILAVFGGALIGLSGGSTDAVAKDQPLLGAALATAGAMAVAVYMIVGRRLRPSLSLTPYIGMVYGAAAVTLSVVVLLAGIPIGGYSPKGYLLIAALALLPQLTGHSSANYLLAYVSATYISLAWQMEPVLSAFAAYIVFAEVPSEWQVVGGLVIMVGVALATINNRELVLRFFKDHRVHDTLWLSALAIYILAGIGAVPFHGDEATTIWMSRDYAYVFTQHDLDRVRFSNPPVNATEQHMRLITGSLTKYLIGILWHIDGYTVDEINDQWDWGADWNYNQSSGHAPDSRLLLVGRWPPTLMLAAGVVVIFAIGKQLGKRPMAYLVSVYYALHPALLLNGRRAMFEGGLILFSLLTVWAMIRLLNRRNWQSTLLLGVVSGLAVSAKHPAAFTVLAVFGAGGLYAMAQMSDRFKLLIQLCVAGVLAGAVFYALHPVWWGDPVARVGQVYEARQGILAGQVAAFGGYGDAIDQIAGFGRQVFVGHLQYYEANAWSEYISDQITHYGTSPWRGIGVGECLPGTAALAILAMAGWFGLWYGQQGISPARWIVGVWATVILVTSLLLTPLEWQRYYLMTYPVIGLLATLGISWLLEPIPVIPRKRVRLGLPYHDADA